MGWCKRVECSRFFAIISAYIGVLDESNTVLALTVLSATSLLCCSFLFQVPCRRPPPQSVPNLSFRIRGGRSLSSDLDRFEFLVQTLTRQFVFRSTYIVGKNPFNCPVCSCSFGAWLNSFVCLLADRTVTSSVVMVIDRSNRQIISLPGNACCL